MPPYQTNGSFHNSNENAIQQHAYDVRDINQQARDAVPVPSMGAQFAGYAMMGVFLVIVLFSLCLSADAIGRSFTKMGKRLLLADGSGHSSMLTEFVVFILVVGMVCGLMAHAFSTYRPIGEGGITAQDTTDTNINTNTDTELPQTTTDGPFKIFERKINLLMQVFR
jgi:hypothetical protein